MRRSFHPIPAYVIVSNEVYPPLRFKVWSRNGSKGLAGLPTFIFFPCLAFEGKRWICGNENFILPHAKKKRVKVVDNRDSSRDSVSKHR